MTGKDGKALASAYGGAGWSPRTRGTREEMGGLWGDFGVDSEWGPLRAVLLHCPGAELALDGDPDAVQMLARPDQEAARENHRALGETYRRAGVTVHALEPHGAVPPNAMFQADLFFMTPEGAILARPASTVRAGEERAVALRLAELGVPILHSVHGDATFEGADALWLDGNTALVATGLRTNAGGARQVTTALREQGVEVIAAKLPPGTMHLMGSLRLLGPRKALVWREKLPRSIVRRLEHRGFDVLYLPDGDEGRRMAMNGVMLGAGRFLMPAGCPRTQALLEAQGLECVTVEIGELAKAAGGVACLTGILQRDPATAAPGINEE